MKWLALILFVPTMAQAEIHSFENYVFAQTEVAKESSKETSSGLESSISFNVKAVEVNALSAKNAMNFSHVEVKGLYLTSNIGQPKLPFKAIIVPGKPSSISVSVEEGMEEVIENIIPTPAQKEACRCELDYANPSGFNVDKKSYKLNLKSPLYRVEYIGDFRGVAYSRVIATPTVFDSANQTLKVYPQLKINITSAQKSLKQKIYANVTDVTNNETLNEVAPEYDYLILTPEKFKDALAPFIAWKQKLGHKFKVATLEEIGSTKEEISKFTHEEYANNKYVYAMIVGTEKVFPTNYLKTSGSAQTPSDSTYFLMGDAADIIPDVYHSRLVAENETQIKNQITKWLKYEQGLDKDLGGFQKGIGIASNEGSNPSDNEYVLSIQNKFQTVLGAFFSHFHQNNVMSKPAHILNAFNGGAFWLTYMGHGDGTGWPSTNVRFTVNDVKKMDNSTQVKPVFIDVACQNGNFNTGMAGETLVNSADSAGNPIGVTAYYGGSVNISWHPPAILARGIAFNYFDKKLNQLGETLFSGHLYLAENYSDKNELAYNYRWYHLFGDPSMRLRDAVPSKFTTALAIYPVADVQGQFKLARKTSQTSVYPKTQFVIWSAEEDRYETVTTDDKGLFTHSELHKFNKFFYWAKNKGLTEFDMSIAPPPAPTPTPEPTATPAPVEPTPAPVIIVEPTPAPIPVL